MYQQITILGNLGGDPVLRYTKTGREVCDMSVAVNAQYTDQNGQQTERTTWFRVSTWDKSAVACATWLHQGATVLVTGEMKEPNVWVDRDGNARASLEIQFARVKFVKTDQTKSAGGQERAARQNAQPAQRRQPVAANGGPPKVVYAPSVADDIPFDSDPI